MYNNVPHFPRPAHGLHARSGPVRPHDQAVGVESRWRFRAGLIEFALEKDYPVRREGTGTSRREKNIS